MNNSPTQGQNPLLEGQANTNQSYGGHATQTNHQNQAYPSQHVYHQETQKKQPQTTKNQGTTKNNDYTNYHTKKTKKRKRYQIFFVDFLRKEFILWTLKKIWKIGFILILLFFVLSVIDKHIQEYMPQEKSYEMIYGNKSGTQKILILPVKGIILGDAPEFWESTFPSENITYGYQLRKQLKDILFEQEIKAVILKIDSYGGTIFGSNAIAQAVQFIEENSEKKVYSIIVGAGVSGGYRVASSTEKVYAELGTQIGGIGVVSGPFKEYDEVVSETISNGYSQSNITAYNERGLGGIHTKYVTAGKGKDLGNPYRSMTNEEHNKIQGGVDKLYKEFVAHVSSGRNLSGEYIKETIGAYSYDSISAKQKGLIDEIGSTDDLINYIIENQKIDIEQLQIIKPVTKMNILTLFGGLLENNPIPYSQNICSPSTIGLVYYGNIEKLCK